MVVREHGIMRHEANFGSCHAERSEASGYRMRV